MTKATDQIASSERAINLGLDFIYRVAGTAEGFERYGALLICCFALVGATSRNASLRRTARTRTHKLAKRWSKLHPQAPPDASPNLITKFGLVRYALSRIGVRDAALNAQIRTAARRFSAQEMLGFDPLSEPPPNDLPYVCECGLENQRGRTYCKQCRRRLQVQSCYRVWMSAFATTYIGERVGIHLGSRYLDVLKWLPTMRPYPAGDEENVEFLRDAIYAVTHIVYSLNDYGTYRLSPRWLPREFAFLKANVAGACERKDPEILGELLDSLKAFGLSMNHPLIVRGTRFLLAEQNEDGSWGDPDEENIRTRCHTTWTAIDGLRAYAWRGQRLSLPEAKSMLRRWARRSVRSARSTRFTLLNN